MKFNYTTVHFPTGTVSETDAEFDSEADFLRHLNKWNRMDGGKYMYTSTKSLSPAGCAAHDFANSVTIKQDRTPESVKLAGGWWTSLKKSA